MMECTAEKKAASHTARDAEDKRPRISTGPYSKSPTLQRNALSDGDLRLGHDDDYSCSPADLARARDLWTPNHPCVAAIDLPLADRQGKEHHPVRQNCAFSLLTGAAN